MVVSPFRLPTVLPVCSLLWDWFSCVFVLLPIVKPIPALINPDFGFDDRFRFGFEFGLYQCEHDCLLESGAIIGNNITAKDVGIVSRLQYNLLAFKGAALSSFVMTLGFIGND